MQIGRAGREGQSATALVMLRDHDFHLMHSLKHTAGADVSGVRRLLELVFEQALNTHDASNAAKGDDTPLKRKASKRRRKVKNAAPEKPAAAAACSKPASGKRRRHSKRTLDATALLDDENDEAPNERASPSAAKVPAASRHAVGAADDGAPANAALPQARALRPQRKAVCSAQRSEGRWTEADADCDADSADSTSDYEPSCDSDREPAMATARQQRGAKLGTGASEVAGVAQETESQRCSAPMTQSDANASAAPPVAAACQPSCPRSRPVQQQAQRSTTVNRSAPAAGPVEAHATQQGNEAEQPEPDFIEGNRQAILVCHDTFGCHISQHISLERFRGLAVSCALFRTAQNHTDKTHMLATTLTSWLLQVVPMADLTKAADTSQEGVDLLLTLLTDCAAHSMQLLGSTMPSFKVGFYKQSATELAQAEPVIAALVATGNERQGVFTGRMEAVARRAGAVPDAVQHTLQKLAAAGQVHLEASKEPAVALSVAAQPGQDVTALARPVHARLQRLQQRAV